MICNLVPIQSEILATPETTTLFKKRSVLLEIGSCVFKLHGLTTSLVAYILESRPLAGEIKLISWLIDSYFFSLYSRGSDVGAFNQI